MKDLWSVSVSATVEGAAVVKRNQKHFCLCQSMTEAWAIVDTFQLMERIVGVQERGDVYLDAPDLKQEDVKVLAHRLGWI